MKQRQMRSMQRHTAVLLAGLVLMLASGRSISAHHSFGVEFDANKSIKLQGTVVKVELINPHSWIYIDVKKPDGTVERWAIEGGSPNSLLRRGVTRDTLKVGAVIDVDGYQARDGSLKANGRDISFPDGRKLFVGSEGAGAPVEGK